MVDTRAELKLHVLPPASEPGQLLTSLLASDAHRSTSAPPVPVPVSLAAQIPGAFELASSAVTVFGVNLPRRLPRFCTAARYDVVLALRDDCDRAAAAAQDAATETAALAPIVRWAIKRVIRAAGELVRVEAACFTRDLFWCCRLTEQHMGAVLARIVAEHGDSMAAWLQRTAANLVPQEAADSNSGGFLEHMRRSFGSPAPQASPPAAPPLPLAAEALAAELWELLAVYVAADRVAPRGLHQAIARTQRAADTLDAIALAFMTAVPRDWLPPVDDCTAPQTPITGHVTEFDWATARGRSAATAHLNRLAGDAVALAHAAPVVVRGAVAEWRACEEWSDEELIARGGTTLGLVRVAPTRRFPFVQPLIAAELASLAGNDALPSCERQVRLALSMPLPHRR